MCKINFKKTLPYIGSILFMIILSYIYFSPDILEGKVLFQGDTQQGIAIGQEGKAFREATGETTRWTNSLFSGMPNFQISPSYANNYWMGQIGRIYHLGLQSPASLVFIMMLGFFHPIIGNENPVVSCIGGSNCLRLFFLFLYYHRSRTHLEIHHSGIYTADNRRYNTGLSR